MNIGTLIFLHNRLAQTTWLFMLIMGLWALGHYIRNQPLGGQFLGIVAVGEILLIVQALLGFSMILFGGLMPPRAALHLLYGIFALVVLPAIYYYTRGEQDRRAALVWFFTGIFMFGLALRLITMG